jgi:type IV secretion system protein VirD4
MSTKARLAIALLVIAFVCVLWTFVAGGVLFLEFKESPLKATWKTIYQGWLQSDGNASMRQHVIRAMQAATFVAVAAVVGVAFAIANLMPKKALHGAARFASIKDIQSKNLFAPSGIVLGRKGNQIIRFTGPEFVLLAAPTRSGKGVGFCIPNLLMWEHSVVVLDIKGENYELTSAYRAEKLGQEVFIFNPFSANTHACNFLSYVSKDPNFRVNDLQAMAATIYPPGDKPFFVDTARNLFVGLAMMVLETPGLPHTLGEVLRQASGKGQSLKDHLETVIRMRSVSPMPFSSICIDSLNRFMSLPDETLGNVEASFTAPLSIFMNPVIDKATSRDDFDFREVRKKKITIYLNIPTDKVTAAPFILNLFFTMLIQENVKELPEQNPALKYSCLLLMDEFTAAGKIEMIEKGVGFIAGYGLRLAIVIQDRSQLAASKGGYGKESAQNIINNMGAKVYFTPNTQEDAESYSKMIGNETVRHESIQRSNIGFSSGNSSRSASEQISARALMLPQELVLMSDKKQLVQRKGIPIIEAEKIIYFEDPEFKDRLASTMQQTKTVDGKPRKVPVPIELPRPNWDLFKSQVLRSDYYADGDLSDLDRA